MGFVGDKLKMGSGTRYIFNELGEQGIICGDSPREYSKYYDFIKNMITNHNSQGEQGDKEPSIRPLLLQGCILTF